MKLRPYQTAGVEFLAARKHALLGDQMRLGKSPQAILAAQKLGAQDILVVCPAIAVEHWKREFRMWWPGFAGNPVIVSYEKAKLLSDNLLAREWDVTIIDEAHYCKNPEAQRTKLVFGKGGLGWKSAHLWALSGTPMPNHPGELWPILRAFGMTDLSYHPFTRRYCTFRWDGNIQGTKTYRVPELRRMLDRIMLRRTRAEVAPEMPDVDFQFLSVNPVSHADIDVPANVSAEWLESNQSVDRENRIEIAKTKALPLAETIAFSMENDLLAQTVCFGWHIEPLHALTTALRARGITVGMLVGSTPAKERVQVQDDFRAGLIQTVVANIQAAGTAIDLSSARHGFFLELSWVGSDNTQAANRLVSMQRGDKVSFDVVSWPGSADDYVQRTLLRKMQGVKAMGLS